MNVVTTANSRARDWSAMTDWGPQTLEDRLLHTCRSKDGGRLFLEVPVGSSGGLGEWALGSKIRRIDAVLLQEVIPQEEEGIISFNDSTEEFHETVSDKSIQLIEAKQKLNRLVIGQVIAGVDMFERQYDAKVIEPVIVCMQGDPALEWVCQECGIVIEIAEPKS